MFRIIKKIIPYLIIIYFNVFINLLFAFQNNIYISNLLILVICFTYFLSGYLKNLYNNIIAKGWILFFFLGVLNINSVNQKTNIWNLDINNASLLYFSCLISFISGLIFFERKPVLKKSIQFEDDLLSNVRSPLSYGLLIFPLLLAVSVFISLGFLPILLGENFTNEMYEYNYGPMYSFKFICAYSFLFAFCSLKLSRFKIIHIVYLLILTFIILIDGKRFLLLVVLLSFMPFWNGLQKIRGEMISKKAMIISFITIGLVYIIINSLRTGNEVNNLFSTALENIPFGVEYKDYVHSFNTYHKIEGYNFELSSLGSFLNSDFLDFIGFKKEQLSSMGSAYTWMKEYDLSLGIRTGIISELYFAYGYYVIPLMILISFFVNKVTYKLANPTGFFNLVQYSILFALFFLLINGQATVFFGCLTMMIYVFVLKKIFVFKCKPEKIDLYSYTST